MAMRRAKKLNKVQRVKAVARERVGAPKPVRVIPDKSLQPQPKHKKSLHNFIDD